MAGAFLRSDGRMSIKNRGKIGMPKYFKVTGEILGVTFSRYIEAADGAQAQLEYEKWDWTPDKIAVEEISATHPDIKSRRREMVTITMTIET
jgi:hypothetical protein